MLCIHINYVALKEKSFNYDKEITIVDEKVSVGKMHLLSSLISSKSFNSKLSFYKKLVNFMHDLRYSYIFEI